MKIPESASIERARERSYTPVLDSSRLTIATKTSLKLGSKAVGRPVSSMTSRRESTYLNSDGGKWNDLIS